MSDPSTNPAEPLTADEEAELAAIQAIKLRDCSTDQIVRELELRSQQVEAEARAAEVEPLETDDVRTITSGAGTITRFRVVAGRKQIIEELIPIRADKVLSGAEHYFLAASPDFEVSKAVFESTERAPGDRIHRDYHRLSDLAPKILSGDPGAVALADRLGIVPVVKWYRSVLPSRVKQVANSDSQAVPQGDAAAAVSEVQAKRDYALTHSKLLRMAANSVTDDPNRARALVKAVGITEEGRPPTFEELQELDAIELDLPLDRA